MSYEFSFPSIIGSASPADHSVVSRMVSFQDAIDRVLDAHNVDSIAYHLRMARAAVMAAYREFPALHDWNHYKRRGTLVTTDSQSTGTIAYTHSTRRVTLTGATWPSPIEHYRIQVDGEVYGIVDRISSTVIELEESDNPGSDVAAGSSYTLVRPIYPAPSDLIRGARMFSFSCIGLSPVYVSDTSLVAMQALSSTFVGSMSAFTTKVDTSGNVVFEIYPAPQNRELYHFAYKAIPRPLQLFSGSPEYTTGTVTASGTSVTGTGTTWTSDMVGCLARFSKSASLPTGVTGRRSLDNPFAEQRVVASVDSATSLTLASSLDSSYTAKAYSIGSPLDLEPQVMLDAFLRRAEWQYAVDVTKYGERSQRESMFQRALELARGEDYRPGPPDIDEVVGFPIDRPYIVAKVT